MALGAVKMSAAALVLLSVASILLLAPYLAAQGQHTELLDDVDCGNVQVQRGFQTHCGTAEDATRRESPPLAMVRQHSVHEDWCERWCELEHTDADCSSCVKPAFPGYMRRMKASERLARTGWGIHIPSDHELRSHHPTPQAGSGRAKGKGAVPQTRKGSLLLGAFSPGTGMAHAQRGNGLATKQSLHQLQTPQTTERIMASLERSEETDESRLVADEQRLARDRALRQHLLRMQQLHKSAARTLSAQHHASSRAAAGVGYAVPDAFAVLGAPRKSPSARTHVASWAARRRGRAGVTRGWRKRVGGRRQGLAGRERVTSTRGRREHSQQMGPALGMLHKTQVPAAEWVMSDADLDLADDFSNGLPSPLGGGAPPLKAAPGNGVSERLRAGRLGGAVARTSRARGRAGAAGGCHNAYDCFGELLSGKDLDEGSLFDEHKLQGWAPPRAQLQVRDPAAYIKSQGLGCHSLSDCLGSFFGGTKRAGQGTAKGQRQKSAKPNRLMLGRRVNVDGWNSAQFTKGLEHGLNLFPPDKTESVMLQRLPARAAPAMALEEEGGGGERGRRGQGEGGGLEQAGGEVEQRGWSRHSLGRGGGAGTSQARGESGDGNVVLEKRKPNGGFLDDETVPQAFGEAPCAACFGGDTHAPLARLGYSVHELGQQVATAEVWGALAKGLEGVATPLHVEPPVIKTGNIGLEPAPMPADPTRTGRFAS